MEVFDGILYKKVQLYKRSSLHKEFIIHSSFVMKVDLPVQHLLSTYCLLLSPCILLSCIFKICVLREQGTGAGGLIENTTKIMSPSCLFTIHD